MSADFYEGVFAGLACVLTGALITFVVMALRLPPDMTVSEVPKPDSLLPTCPDDARELTDA